MNEPTMEKLIQRMDCLEQENWHLKRIGALVVVGIVTVVLMGQASPSKVSKLVEAERFILRDSNGRYAVALTSISSIALPTSSGADVKIGRSQVFTDGYANSLVKPHHFV